MTQRPKFLESYLRLLTEEVGEHGIIAMVPYWFLFFSSIGTAVAVLVPKNFWSDEYLEVATAVYSGILTFNGLVLVLGWNAFSRVHDILINKSIGKFIYEKGLLNDYLVHIDAMHIWQSAAVLFSGVGLITVLLDFIYPSADYVVFALTAICTMYGLKQAVDSVRVMNDLVWQAAVFEYSDNENGGQLKSIDGGKTNGSR